MTDPPVNWEKKSLSAKRGGGMLEGLGVPIRGLNFFEYVIVQISVIPPYRVDSGEDGSDRSPSTLFQDTPFSTGDVP